MPTILCNAMYIYIKIYILPLMMVVCCNNIDIVMTNKVKSLTSRTNDWLEFQLNIGIYAGARITT